MENHSKTLLALLVGAAAGAAIGFYLASDDKEEIVQNLKKTARNITDALETELVKGKKLAEELKSHVDDLLNNA